MSHNYFYDIAVYRCSPEKHQKECELERIRIAETEGFSPVEFPKQYKYEIMRSEEEMGSWLYNQIIGWIRLYIHGCSIKGEYWKVTALRIPKRLRNKTFGYEGKIFENPFIHTWNNDKIRTELAQALVELAKTKRFRNRFVEIEKFFRLSNHIDWVEVFNPRQ